MSDPYAQYRTDEAPGEGVFAQLHALIAAMDERAQAVVDAEGVLKKAQADYADVAEKQIPELLDEMGMSEFTDKDGRKVTIKTKIRASIPVAKRPAAYAWLEREGHGGLIKRTIAVALNRGQDEEAKQLLEELSDRDFAGVKQDMKVEPATLTSFISQQLEAGEPVPDDLFSVFEVRQAKITQPKP